MNHASGLILLHFYRHELNFFQHTELSLQKMPWAYNPLRGVYGAGGKFVNLVVWPLVLICIINEVVPQWIWQMILVGHITARGHPATWRLL